MSIAAGPLCRARLTSSSLAPPARSSRCHELFAIPSGEFLIQARSGHPFRVEPGAQSRELRSSNRRIAQGTVGKCRYRVRCKEIPPVPMDRRSGLKSSRREQRSLVPCSCVLQQAGPWRYKRSRPLGHSWRSDRGLRCLQKAYRTVRWAEGSTGLPIGGVNEAGCGPGVKGFDCMSLVQYAVPGDGHRPTRRRGASPKASDGHPPSRHHPQDTATLLPGDAVLRGGVAPTGSLTPASTPVTATCGTPSAWINRSRPTP